MTNRKILFSSLLWLFACSLFAQSNQPNPMARMPVGTDLFGQNYAPLIGWLEPKVDQSISGGFAQYFPASVFNSLRGNAYTTYGLLDKANLKLALDEAQSFGYGKKTLRRYYYQASVGVHFLMQMDFRYCDLKVRADTVWLNSAPPRADIKRYTEITANYTLRLTDVRSSKVVAVENYDIRANSEQHPRDPKTAPTDSVRAFRALCKAAGYASSNFLNSNLNGAGRVTSILEESKEKAKVVSLNNCPQAWLPKETRVGLWRLHKKFPLGPDTIRHVERIGELEKPSDFTSLKINFEVKRGEKAAYEAMKSGQSLFCLTENYPRLSVSPAFLRPSLVLDSFDNATRMHPRLLETLRSKVGAWFADRPALVDLVDRDVYNFIEKERKMQQKTLSDATEQGVTVGAEYAAVFEVTEYKLDQSTLKKEQSPEPAPQKQPAPKEEKDKKEDSKPPAVEKPRIQFRDEGKMIPSEISFSAWLRVNVKLVAIGSGEVVFAGKVETSIARKIPYTQDRDKIETAKENVFKALSEQFALMSGDLLAPYFSTGLRVLETAKSDGETADQLLVQGGSQYGFQDRDRFEVIETTTETVDGQTLVRATSIGELKVSELFPETMICKIKEGGKAILEKINGKANLSVRIKGQ